MKNLTDAQRMSDKRHISPEPYEDGVDGYSKSAEDEYFELRSIYSFDGIDTLTDSELSRLYKYFELQMTYKEIAEEEGVAYSAVRKSVQKAIEKLKKFL